MISIKRLLCAGLAALCFTGVTALSTSASEKISFSDVEETSWYAGSVAQVQSLGLMQGVESDHFAPLDKVTVAEVITLAARLHSAYSGQSIPAKNGTWYEPYVAYADSEGLLAREDIDSFTRPATRAEAASLIAAALPVESFAPINNVTSIPDVSLSAPYSEAVYTLYNAGVMMGTDEYGSFEPHESLLRAEIATILCRTALPNERQMRSVKSQTPRDAYLLVDSFNMAAGRNGLANAWKYDNKNQIFNASGRDSSALIDSDPSYYSALYRDFAPESEGILTWELIFSARTTDDGIYLAFAGEDEQPAFGLSVKNGYFTLFGSEELVTDVAVSGTSINACAAVLTADLDANTLSVRLQNKCFGPIAIPDVSIERLILSTTTEGTGYIEPHQVLLSKNYPVSEHFFSVDPLIGQMPRDWTVSGNMSVQSILSNYGTDVYSARINASAGSTHTARKTFQRISGKGIYEAYILLPQKLDGAYFSLGLANNELLRIETKNGAWYAGDVRLRDYTANIWQSLRIDTDPDAGTATIKICGKAVATVPFTEKCTDNLTIGFAPSASGVMWFDDITARAYVDHADYPSEPVVAESKNHNIGIHICNLWHDSASGEGWDSSSPFAELEPYLGFYDEGSAELADWEIKMMVEHGIDFQHMCWYAPYGNLTAPIKLERVSGAALHNGFMNARYSDLMTFCLMWENSNKDVSSLVQFQTYLWPYWMEYYFSDPRYTVLDNKPVLTVWSYNQFISSFGGVEGAKEAIAFMREDIKKLGYDGLILLFADGHQMTKSFFDNILNLGADGAYPYHFNRTGSDPDHQIYRMSTQISFNSAHTVPAVSVGFNDIGRNEQRSGLITPAGHKKVCEYIRDTALPARSTGTWKDNTFFVSTWNEYSEGTYVCPSGDFGYAYLENIREVFTNSKGSHTDIDVIPTDAQVARVSHMYPTDSQPIRWYQFEASDVIKSPVELDALKKIKTWDFTQSAARKEWEKQFGLKTYDASGSVIAGSSDGYDYAIRTVSSNLGIDTSKVEYLHIRLKTSVKSRFEVFFITNSDTTWNDQKYVSTNISEANTFCDYYVDMAENKNWKGTLKQLRIDPLTAPGSFEISLIELVYEDTTSPIVYTVPTVKLNNRKMNFNFLPVLLSDGDMEVTADPRKGFFSQLRLYHEWDRYTGTLRIDSVEHSYIFKVGQSTVSVDGVPTALGYTFRLRDGLPVFRIKKLCELLGYPVHASGKLLTIQCATDEEYAIITSRKDNEWEFALEGDIEGFSAQSASLYADGTFLTLTSTGADPAFLSPSLSVKARKYTRLAVGVVANKSVMNGQFMQLFFTRSDATSMSEDKSIKLYYDVSKMTDGKVYEMVFDLTSTDEWKGLITKLRIDPFNRKDAVAVDYIRLLP